MKKAQITALLKKGSLSPFMVAKLVFNDFWKNNHLQEPIFSHNEKQSLIDKMPWDEFHQYKKWRDWFEDIHAVYKAAKENYFESEAKLFQLLWFIGKDLNREETRVYFKNMYPVPVTEKQYQDLKRKDRENKLKEKYSIVWCLIEIIEGKLPGPEKGATLEDYIYQDEEYKAKDRKLIAGHFKQAVKQLLALIDQGKITPTRKSQLLSVLKATLKKTPDQIAEILLGGIYTDVEAPVKILESSTVSGEQLYNNFKEWAKYIDTFHPETGGGYAIVQETNPLFLDKNGYYKPFPLIDDFLNGGSYKKCFSIKHAYSFFAEKLNTMADRFQLFQFYRMILDILSDKLAIPLNNPNEKIGMESLKEQAEKLEIFRDVLFLNLVRISSSNKDLKKNLSPLFTEYQAKTVEQYYPNEKVVGFCKTKIGSIMSGDFDNEWFYNIKDFYMKEERIKLMSTEEIESLKSMGNKEQVKHFTDLVKQSSQVSEKFSMQRITHPCTESGTLS